MYMYICVHVYIYTCIRMYTYVNKYICIRINIYMFHVYNFFVCAYMLHFRILPLTDPTLFVSAERKIAHAFFERSN